jgi:2,4-didehydro-3-deoxy-L-rhamnonate hydrolase
MKWLSFGEPGSEKPGVLLNPDEVLDVSARWPEFPTSWRCILTAGLLDQIQTAVAAGDYTPDQTCKLAGLTLGPPITDPSKFIALGRNYAAHAAEQNRKVTEMPLLFSKATTCLLGHEGEVIVPPEEHKPDFEAEMVLVIGKKTKRVSPEEAMSHVSGITAGNDVSGREAQFLDKLWFRGKGMDTFGPIGPWVVTLDEVGDLSKLAIKMVVNGEVMQEATTADLVFGSAEIVSYISQTMTLLPGDLISTGTPSGVGVFRDPPIFLQNGDRMEVHLEKVGVLINTVVR